MEADLMADITDDHELAKEEFIKTANALFNEQIGTLTDYEIFRHLVVNDYHKALAMDSLAKTLNWRDEYKTNTILIEEEMVAMEQSGKLQIYGKAIDNSDIMIWTGSRHSSKGYAKEARFVIYMMEKWRSEYKSKNRLTIIFDRRNHTQEKNQMLAIGPILIPMLQKHYPCVLSRMYIFPNDAMFKLAYNVLKLQVSKETQSKIKFSSDPSCLCEWIEPPHLFKRFGGVAEDPVERKLSTIEQITIKKSAVSSPTAADLGIELIWAAPAEFNDILT